MHITVLMHVRNPGQSLVHDSCYFSFIELLISPAPLLHLMKQVTICIFEYYVNFVVFFIVNHFFEFYQEDAVVKSLQRCHLWHVQTLGPGCELSLHFLDGDELLIIVVDALNDRPIGAFSQFFDKLILFHVLLSNI